MISKIHKKYLLKKLFCFNPYLMVISLSKTKRSQISACWGLVVIWQHEKLHLLYINTITNKKKLVWDCGGSLSSQGNDYVPARTHHRLVRASSWMDGTFEETASVPEPQSRWGSFHHTAILDKSPAECSQRQQCWLGNWVVLTFFLLHHHVYRKALNQAKVQMHAHVPKYFCLKVCESELNVKTVKKSVSWGTAKE